MSLGNLAAAIEKASAPGGPIRAERIAICHVASGDLWAGAEAQMAMLLRGLAREKDLHLYVILLNEGRLAEEIRRWGIDVKVIPENGKSFLETFAEATVHLQGKGVRILHSHRYKENLLAALLAWRCKIPFVVRSQQGLAEPFKGLKRWKHGLIQLTDRIVARYATTYLVCASRDIRNQFVRFVDVQKVVTIHNAVDRELVYSDLTSVHAKRLLGLPEDCLVVGFVGRLEPIKRPDIFLLAATRTAAQLPNVRFVMVGDGSEATRLHELARTVGLGERVMFLGQRTDVYDVLRACDTLVLCSDHEGLPTVLLESHCLGVPVVARSVGGIPEVIQNGVNGILVESANPTDLADACTGILKDSDRRKRLAAAGHDLIKVKFTAEHTAGEVAKLYRTCVRPHQKWQSDAG